MRVRIVEKFWGRLFSSLLDGWCYVDQTLPDKSQFCFLLQKNIYVDTNAARVQQCCPARYFGPSCDQRTRCDGIATRFSSNRRWMIRRYVVMYVRVMVALMMHISSAVRLMRRCLHAWLQKFSSSWTFFTSARAVRESNLFDDAAGKFQRGSASGRIVWWNKH